MSKQHAPGEYYHVFNRGMHKQDVFKNDTDRLRFLFLVLIFQGEVVLKNISREVRQNVQSSTLHINRDLENDALKSRAVELVSFCLMPNHFHLIIKELKDGAIAKYMQRLLTAYTKYFNTKYDHTGHLFQGSYKSVWISDDRQLMHLSAYIHKNSRELKNWKGREGFYPWSSYQDYLSANRFGELLATGVVMDRYKKDEHAYEKFVKTSLAKEFVE
jgi:putative transposase